MADQDNKKNEDLDDLEPILDEDAFSLDLDDFDLGDDDLEESPGIEPPSLDDVASFDDDEEGISDLVLSSADSDDDLLDIDLDSDLNLLGEEDPVLPDDHDVHPEFLETENTLETVPSSDDDLELEFDDDLIDIDQEIEAILNGEDGILSNKQAKPSEFSPSDEDEGPIALSMEELENITGGLIEEDEAPVDSDLETMEPMHLDEEGEEEVVFLPDNSIEDEHDLSDHHADLDLDFDDSEVDTELSFRENGAPDLILDDDENEVESDFKPLRDPEEEELFGQAKEDENLTLSDEELGDILGANSESLEESLGSEEEFLETEELPSFDDEPSEHSFESAENPSEEEEEGPITLSFDELENIAGESEEESSLNILDEEPEDETITLSPDELGNIIGSEEIEEEDIDSVSDDAILEVDEIPDLSLGDEESKEEESSFDLFGEDEDQEPDDEVDSVPGAGLEGDLEEDEGPLALSMEELESIAGDAEEAADEELVDSLDRAPLPYEEEITKPEFSDEDVEDESIALSMEELENITAGEEEVHENEEPTETVSVEKIDDLLGEEIPGEDLADIAELPMEDTSFDLPAEMEDTSAGTSFGDKPDLVEHDDLIEFSDGEEGGIASEPTLSSDLSEPVFIDLDEYALDGKLSPLEELRASEEPAKKTESLADTDLDSEFGQELSVADRKKVLGYLDNLLGNLPDDVIKEFSKSQYFDLYKKLMKELGL
ncbi:hypothetical protein LPTSP4_20800 [Leptospira ryugenii]|uniref:Uncharacterized protein n=1 Tax=Leptospira ryugenii TaxID=1917863 RepID=A0A2P2E103_9LEPT|nr:hypothetical protein [Leptospira ryugenii]GBF50554.1 hypothetical protein LPTSP4_20800 [Leptospira ryugenii]